MLHLRLACASECSETWWNRNTRSDEKAEEWLISLFGQLSASASMLLKLLPNCPRERAHSALARFGIALP